MSRFRLQRRPLVDTSGLPAELPPLLRRLYASRGVCAGHGFVSLPLHRSDARLGERTPAACCREQALSVAWRERSRDT